MPLLNDVIVRKAGAEEMRRIAHLKQQIHQLHVNGRSDLFAPMQSFDVYEENALAKGLQLMIAEQDGKVLGYALINYVDRPASPYMNARCYLHVEEFCVDESCHRQGVGRKLMEAIRKDAAENNCPRIELDVWAFNEGARQFYESVGFTTYRYFMEMKIEE